MVFLSMLTGSHLFFGGARDRITLSGINSLVPLLREELRPLDPGEM